MSAQFSATPVDGIGPPDDPEAVVDEISEPGGEDYGPPDRIDPEREATVADMADQAAEVPVTDETEDDDD